MSFNDPIAEMLTKIRNARAAKHRYVEISLSKEKLSIAKILKEEGFIDNFISSDQRRKVRIFLKYNDRKSVINGIKRISKPGLRRYVGHDKIPYVLGGIGTAIISTSKGVVCDRAARRLKVGGELLCLVW
jgi:small subunit ribosomal protein S8